MGFMITLLDEFKQTLDKLVEDGPEISLMCQIEDILDNIQVEYGQQIYQKFNKCYEIVLLIPKVSAMDKKEIYMNLRERLPKVIPKDKDKYNPTSKSS